MCSSNIPGSHPPFLNNKLLKPGYISLPASVIQASSPAGSLFLLLAREREWGRWDTGPQGSQKGGTNPGPPNAKSSRAAALCHPRNCYLNMMKFFLSSTCCVSNPGTRSDSKCSEINSSALALIRSSGPHVWMLGTVISGICLLLQQWGFTGRLMILLPVGNPAAGTTGSTSPSRSCCVMTATRWIYSTKKKNWLKSVQDLKTLPKECAAKVQQPILTSISA